MAKKQKSKTPGAPRLSHEHFLNRELQALEFNRRVLAQAEDRGVPLLERLKFLCIVSSNLDEFFEIRVAGLKESIRLGLHDAGPDARSAAEVFDAVSREAHALVAEQYKLLNEVVLPSLARAGRLYAYRHQGFWKSMDTYKDALELTTLAIATEQEGRFPWLRSVAQPSS